MDYLNRALAPFSEKLWQEIDDAAVKAARDRLTGRRFLPIDGPFGIGLTAIERGDDEYCRQPASNEAGALMGRSISVPMIRRAFRLSIRRVAGYLDKAQPLDLKPAEDAAEAVADREEEFIYRGQTDFQLPGLLTCDGRLEVPAGDWSAIERALEDVLAAATALDDAGFRGPYALALAPALYNGLFRLYPGTELLQLEHLRRLCTRGIYKAAIEGGVLIDPRAATLVIGQDLRSGYAGQDGMHYQLYLSESLVLRIDDAKGVCVIPAAAPKRAAGEAGASRGGRGSGSRPG